MPESLELQIEEVSEAALIERIQLRKVRAAVDLYDELLQAGQNSHKLPKLNTCGAFLYNANAVIKSVCYAL